MTMFLNHGSSQFQKACLSMSVWGQTEKQAGPYSQDMNLGNGGEERLNIREIIAGSMVHKHNSQLIGDQPFEKRNDPHFIGRLPIAYHISGELDRFCHLAYKYLFGITVLERFSQEAVPGAVLGKDKIIR